MLDERGVIHMKRKLIVCLLTCVMAFSFVVPAMASEAVKYEPVYSVTYQEVAPRTEMTRLYFRTYHGVLQFRVWSITNGRWITDWTNV